jgi:hypothetical protein
MRPTPHCDEGSAASEKRGLLLNQRLNPGETLHRKGSTALVVCRHPECRVGRRCMDLAGICVVGCHVPARDRDACGPVARCATDGLPISLRGSAKVSPDQSNGHPRCRCRNRSRSPRVTYRPKVDLISAWMGFGTPGASITAHASFPPGGTAGCQTASLPGIDAPQSLRRRDRPHASGSSAQQHRAAEVSPYAQPCLLPPLLRGAPRGGTIPQWHLAMGGVSHATVVRGAGLRSPKTGDQRVFLRGFPVFRTEECPACSCQTRHSSRLHFPEQRVPCDNNAGFDPVGCQLDFAGRLPSPTIICGFAAWATRGGPLRTQCGDPPVMNH